MANQHQTTLRSKTYLVGKLANVIWGEKYFMDNSTKMSFGKMIHDMYELNLRHKKYSTRHVHIDGVASIQLDYT